MLYAPACTVKSFNAFARIEDGQVRVRWQTADELGVNAFRVLRQRNNGTPEPVGATGYVRTQGDEAGGIYELADPAVRAGETVRYKLLIVSRHGPEQPVAEWGGVIGTVTAAVPAARAPQTPAVPAQVWIGSGDRVRAWTGSAPADRVRLGLREEGIYRVSAQELADASGWDAASVANAIAGTNLSLSCQGAPVGWHADGDGLFFYGIPVASRFAPENVYWIAWGPGSHMPHQAVAPEVPATTNEWFVDQVTRQGTGYLSRVSFSTLAGAPAPYVAFALLEGVDVFFNFTNSVAVNAALTDFAAGCWTGSVTVNLLSVYEGEVSADSHTARMSVGGTPVGETSWAGEQYVSFTCPFSSTNLTGNLAALKIENVLMAPSDYSLTDTSRFLCMSFSFSYPRFYRARDNALRCTGGNSNTVAVSGFATNDIAVLDVTVTNAPVAVGPVTLTYDGGATHWIAAFPCGTGGKVYQVFSRSSGVRQPSIRGVRDVDWSSPALAADYMILIPPEAWRDGFRQAMQPLADYRNAQGLRTKIVDVEALYNAFSEGLADPLAIRAFCAAVYPNGLKYLLLAGAGALDFKHESLSVNDYTACLIPTLITGQGFKSSGEGMTVALDAALGDVDADDVPDVTVGRMPTTKTNELAEAVRKTIAYERASLRADGTLAKRYAAVAADRDNDPLGKKYYRFSLGTDRLIVPIQDAGRTFITNYPAANTANALAIVKTNSLIPALKAGAGLFHFFGHSNKLALGYDPQKLLHYSEITTGNWQKPAIAVIVGCQANVWQYLTPSVTIVPYGLFAPDTGFVAGLGATGYMLGNEGEELAVGLYTAAAEQGALRLGDVFRRGIHRMAGIMPVERLLCYSLVGDPALVVRHDISAMGTAIPWLVEYGLTEPNADLDDPDLDGWPTWQEFQANTCPTNHALRIKSARLNSSGRWMIAFEADSNRLCRVEYKASLLATDEWQAISWAWTNMTEWATPETLIRPPMPVTTVEVPVSGMTTQGFYRIHGMNE